ncbi:MAG: 2-oxoacid:acceptor oxidoreductase family protein [Candidatus Heimdallarchaeaceae archaeon]
MSRLEIKFCGFGGQGIATMGAIVGEAIALYENKYTIMTQSYGPESRGGASSADVVVDDDEIDFPLVTEPDYMILMSEEAYEKYVSSLKEGGILFVEKDLVKLDDKAKKAKKILEIPATEIAESLGSKIYANIVMLGFFCANSDVVSETALINTIKRRIRQKYIEKNLIAFEKGKNYNKEG